LGKEHLMGEMNKKTPHVGFERNWWKQKGGPFGNSRRKFKGTYAQGFATEGSFSAKDLEGKEGKMLAAGMRYLEAKGEGSKVSVSSPENVLGAGKSKALAGVRADQEKQLKDLQVWD